MTDDVSAACASGTRRLQVNWSQWVVSFPPALFLLLFFAVPALIMVVASFRYPGEFGGLEPFNFSDIGENFSLETYEFFFSDWF